MKKINKMLSCIIALAIIAISVFVPVTVSAAEYVIPDGAKFITDTEIGRILVGIEPGTTLAQLKAVFADYTVTAKNINNTSMADTDKIGSGCVVTVSSEGSVVDEFTTVVYGDIDGDGLIAVDDSVVLMQTVLGNSELSRAGFIAGDISDNSKNDASDMLNLSLHMLGIKNIDQTISSEESLLGKQVRIVTIGDSITEGMGTFNSYRTQLAKELYSAGANIKFVGPRQSPDPRVTSDYYNHAGWSGWFVGPTTSGGSGGIYNELPNIFPYDDEGNPTDVADIGLMMIGHNNYFRNVALVDSETGRHIFEDEYKNLVREIFVRQPNITLYCATMVNQDNGHSPDYNYQDGGVMGKNYGFTYSQAQNANLHTWVQDLVDEGYDVKYFDLCGATNLSAANGDFNSNDGTHPNEQGQAKMGHAWFTRIVDDVLARNNAETSGQQEVMVKSVAFNKTSLNLYEGYDDTLTVSYTPENANFRTVVWTSSNNNIATVDTVGNVHAKKPGTCTITATSLSGNVSAYCTVTVETDPAKTEMPVNLFNTSFNAADAHLFTESSKTAYFNNEIYLNGFDVWLETAETFDLGNNWAYSQVMRDTINYAVSYGDKYYINMSVGKITARIIDSSKKFELLYDGEIIDTNTANYDITQCRYTLRYKEGKVMLIKESLVTGVKQILLSGEIPNENYYSTASIYNYELWRGVVMNQMSVDIFE